TVGMGNKGPCHAEHARITRKRTRGKLGQLTIKAGRQVLANLPHLLFDDVVVIEQPLSSRLYTTATLEFRRACAIGGQKSGGVVVQAFSQGLDALRPRCNRLRSGQAAGVLPEPFYTEKFMPDRGLVVPRRRVSYFRFGSDC